MAIVVPSANTIIPEASAVTLARYAQITQSDECAFWGVRYEGQERLGCGTIWSKQDRDNILKYLALAQEKIEAELRYPLMPKWIVGNQAALDDQLALNLYVDQQPYNPKVMETAWVKLIEAGIRAETMVEAGATLAYTGSTPLDTASVTVATAVDVDELYVYHPDTDVEITPSSVSVAGGSVTFTFPRCRLVRAEYADNPQQGWYVEDDSRFETEVDIVRIYNDPSTNAVLIGNPNSCNSQGCSNSTRTACIRIQDSQTGVVNVCPATYTNGVWQRQDLNNCTHKYHTAQLFYRAGLLRLPRDMEDAIVRLAHSLMPTEPCGCEYGQRLWQRDRTVPELLTPQRMNCPFGLNDGAWQAWLKTQKARVMRFGVI